MRPPARTSRFYPMTATALLAAILAAVSPFALFLGPIPVSFCTLLLYLSGYLMGWRRAILATLLYLLMGMAGLPVFSGFSGGFGKVFGPTGGYLAGYLAVTFCSAFALERFPSHRVIHLLGMLCGTLALYILGTAWYCFSLEQPVSAALSLCVIPFLPGDLLKIVLSLWIGPVLRQRLTHAGFL